MLAPMPSASESDGSGGEPGALSQPSQGVAQIARPGIEPGQAAPFAIVLLGLRHPAELAQGGRAGGFAGHAGGAEFGLLQGQVRGDFFIQFAIQRAAPQERGQAEEQGAHRAHSPSAPLRKRCISATVRPHSSVSCAICRRPARVSS